MGVHHAREWPSGEHAMEWGFELINGFKSGDARATNIVRNSRNIVVPIVNPDGFEASRGAVGAPGEGRDEAVDDTVYLVGGAATGGEYRRKNCRLPDNSEAGNCTHARPGWPRTASTRTATTAASGAARARTRATRWSRPTAAPARSPSPSRATSRRSSRATRW